MGPVQIHKEQGSHAQNGEQGQEPLQSPVTGGVFYPDAAPSVPQEQAVFFGRLFYGRAGNGVDFGKVSHASTFFRRKLVSRSTRMTMTATSRMTPMAEWYRNCLI